MLGLSLLADIAVHLVSSGPFEGIEEGLAMVVLRRRRSDWGLVGQLPSWEGSRHTEMAGVHCMRHMRDGHRILAALLVSWKLRVEIRSRGGL